jgi:hypothetical protein
MTRLRVDPRDAPQQARHRSWRLAAGSITREDVPASPGQQHHPHRFGRATRLLLRRFGPSADWFRNVQAAPALEVAIGRRRFRPQHRILDETEAAGVLAGYEQRNRLIAPIVRLALSWLAGWPYDGSDAARARLVRQLPMVGFRPCSV